MQHTVMAHHCSNSRPELCIQNLVPGKLHLISMKLISSVISNTIQGCAPISWKCDILVCNQLSPVKSYFQNLKGVMAVLNSIIRTNLSKIIDIQNSAFRFKSNPGLPSLLLAEEPVEKCMILVANKHLDLPARETMFASGSHSFSMKSTVVWDKEATL